MPNQSSIGMTDVGCIHFIQCSISCTNKLPVLQFVALVALHHTVIAQTMENTVNHHHLKALHMIIKTILSDQKGNQCAIPKTN